MESKDKNEFSIEERVQRIINDERVKVVINSMYLVSTINNEVYLILDNSIISKDFKLYFEEKKILLGTKEDFFMSGGDRVEFVSIRDEERISFRFEIEIFETGD